MQGSVGVRSRADVGSTFWVELSLPAVREHHSVMGDGMQLEHPLEGVRVLVVEDNIVNMLIACETLYRWGAQVTQAANGLEAVNLLLMSHTQNSRAPTVDVVLMDMHMPEMNGLQATRVLRERYTQQQLPIIALTAAALANEHEEAIEAGMNEFVVKPIDPAQLLSAILNSLDAPSFPDLAEA
jgi:CheY-like chemotaxis protein